MAQSEPEQIQALNAQFEQLYPQGDYEQALRLAERSYALSQQAYDSDHYDVATSLNNLALIYQDMRVLTRAGVCRAKPLYEQALAMQQRLFEGDHVAVARSLNGLARHYQDMGNFARAQPLYEQALAMQQRLFEGDHVAVARSLNGLARLYRDMGDFARAQTLYEQALAMRRRLFEGDDVDVAASLNNLAGLHREMWDLTEAVPLLEQALAMLQRLHAGDHPDVAMVRNKLAAVRREMSSMVQSEPEQLKALNNQVEQLYPQGDYEEALRSAEQFYHLNQQRIQRHDHASWMTNLAALHHALGNYDQALPLYERALASNQHRHLGDHPDVADSLHRLATLYKEMGDLSRALPLYKQALAMGWGPYPDYYPDVAQHFKNLFGHLNFEGRLHQGLGQFSRALPFYEQSLAMRQCLNAGDDDGVADSLDNLARAYHDLGDFARALPLYEQALAMWQRLYPREDKDVARALSNLARAYHDLGDLNRATTLCEQALAMRRLCYWYDHPDVANSLNNLAALCQAMGDFSRALPLYEQALAMRHRLDASDYRDVTLSLNRDIAHSLSNLAAISHRLGDLPRALALYKQALDKPWWGRGDHPDVADSLHTRARLYQAMGDFAQATSLLEQALAMRQRLFAGDHPSIANSLNNLGLLYRDMGDFARAAPLLEQALAMTQRLFAGDHPNVANSLNNLAALYRNMGDFAQAVSLCKQALAMRQRLFDGDHPDVAASLHELATLYGTIGRPQDALSLTVQAMTIDAQLIGQVFAVGSEQQRMAYLHTLEGNLYVFLSLVLRHFWDTSDAIRTAFDLVLRRKALGAEALAMQRETILGGQYPDLVPQLHELNILRMQIARKTLDGPGPEGLPTHQKRLAEWRGDKDRLEADLARQIPEMNLERQLRDVDCQVVAWALPDATTLVEFVRFPVYNFQAVRARGESLWQPPRYVAFTLPAGEPDRVQLIDLGEADPIDQMIATYRGHLIFAADPDRLPAGADLASDDLDVTTDAGEALRIALYDPIAQVLPSDCTHCLLAPDGALTQLPFEVLPLDDGHYLGDSYALTYLSTGRDVLRLTAEITVEATTPLIAADPDFDLSGDTVAVDADFDLSRDTAASAPEAASENRAYGRHSKDLEQDIPVFGRLPGTRVEGERIATLLGVPLWLEGDVLEGPIKARQSPRIVHLATHGGFLPDQPQDPNATDPRLTGPGMENPMLRSFLVMAGVNTWLQRGKLPDEAEDGMLTAEDVSGLNLLGTELVVLSACDTGRGEVQNGEGVFGLRRAFALAGAQTLVMSLWQVDDLATAVLMTQFYTHLLAGQGRGEALRHAQTDVRQITVAALRADWLTPEMIERLAAGNLKRKFELLKLAAQPDDHCPFQAPYFWGAFICQGVTAPLRQALRQSRPDETHTMPPVPTPLQSGRWRWWFRLFAK